MFPAPDEYPPQFQPYLNLVPPTAPVLDVLRGNFQTTEAMLREVTEEQARSAYAPGKWTLKQVLGHLSDMERVFSYRILRAARGDSQTLLATYADDDWAAAYQVHDVPLPELLENLHVVRLSTVALLRHLSAADWMRTANVNDSPMTVRALAYIIAGHERHHQHLMRGKYLLS